MRYGPALTYSLQHYAALPDLQVDIGEIGMINPSGYLQVERVVDKKSFGQMLYQVNSNSINHRSTFLDADADITQKQFILG